MTDAFHQTGGCQCGALRYTLASAPLVIYCCHCTECQKQSSSAFGISVRVDARTVTLAGKTSVFTRQSVSDTMECHFCGTCGSRLFHRRPAYGHLMNIKGGTFDDTSWLHPAGHIWTRSKQPWVTLPADTLTYDAQPENYDALTARYQVASGLGGGR